MFRSGLLMFSLLCNTSAAVLVEDELGAPSSGMNIKLSEKRNRPTNQSLPLSKKERGQVYWLLKAEKKGGKTHSNSRPRSSIALALPHCTSANDTPSIIVLDLVLHRYGYRAVAGMAWLCVLEHLMGWTYLGYLSMESHCSPATVSDVSKKTAQMRLNFSSTLQLVFEF